MAGGGDMLKLRSDLCAATAVHTRSNAQAGKYLAGAIRGGGSGREHLIGAGRHWNQPQTIESSRVSYGRIPLPRTSGIVFAEELEAGPPKLRAITKVTGTFISFQVSGLNRHLFNASIALSSNTGVP